jgi:hypothetical protein
MRNFARGALPEVLCQRYFLFECGTLLPRGVRFKMDYVNHNLGSIPRGFQAPLQLSSLFDELLPLYPLSLVSPSGS